jgi:flagellar biosynthesis protein FlhA
MSVEIGFGLVPLVDQRLNGDLVERIGLIRDQIRDELGFLIPSISVQDNLELGNNEYRILVRGLERARGTVQVGSRLAINPGDVAGPMEGVRTTDPAFGFEAVWINPRRADAAEAKGYTVVDCSSVIATHVTRIIREHAGDLLSRQGVSDLLDELRRTDAAVIQELVPARLQIGVVHRVLQFLLGEQVPIHDLAGILETLSDFADQTKDPMVLCEYCRQTLKGHIVSGHLAVDGTLYAIILHPELEAELQQALGQPGGRGIAALAPERVDALTDRVLAAYENAARQVESDVVLLTGPLIRPHLCRMVERKVPDMPVLSYAEVADDVSMRILGTVSAPSPASQAGVGTAERLRAASAV